MEKVANFTQFEQKNTHTSLCIIVHLCTIATVTVHICTVTVAIVHKYTIMHKLVWVFFCSNCVKLATFSILYNYAQADVIALRAITLAGGKDFVYFTQKTYFFYFIPSLLQNTHISLSILQYISIKYSFFINFLLFSIMVILF